MSSEANRSGRRKFIRSLSGFGAAGLIGTALPSGVLANIHSHAAADPEKGHVFLTAPYLQNPAPGSMTVMWIANLPSYNWVEFGESERLGQKAQSSHNGIIDSYNRLNCITLENLKPATRYYYRVCSKEITGFEPYNLTYGKTIQSRLYQFSTPAENPKELSMLILNDIHDRPYSFKDLMQYNDIEHPDFVFLNGDMFDYQTNEQQIIDHLIQPCTDTFASRIPFMFVRGNHETRGKFRRDLLHYFYNPEGKQYFAFTWGPVHFTVLDTGEDKPDEHPVYAGIVDFDDYRREQARWAEGVMQSHDFKRAKFRVALLHIPQYYSGDWHGTMHVRELFAPLFNKHKIDISISGHTHQYGVHEPVKGEHDYPIIIGGGPLKGKRTLIKLRANEKELHLNMLRDDGVEVGKYQLTAKR